MDRRKRRHIEQWNDMVARLLPEKHKIRDDGLRVLSRTVTFQVTEDCNLDCTYCLSGDTRIRMADFSEKEIKDIKLGDTVLGFEENTQGSKRPKVLPSKVEQLFQRTSDTLEICLECGEKIRITPNHKVLTKKRKRTDKEDFVAAGDLSVGDFIYYHPIIDSDLELHPIVFDENYKIGYLVAMILGDGSLKHYNRKSDGCDVFKFRIAVKDIEIINRCKQFLTDFNIPYYTKPYLISKKHGLWQEAIFANTRKTYNLLKDMISNNFMVNGTISYYQGFLSGIYDAEGNIGRCRVIRICNTDRNIIQETMTGMDLLNIPYVLEIDEKGTKNKPFKYNIRIVDNTNGISAYRFIKSINPSVPRKTFERYLNYSPLKKNEIISIKHIKEEIPVYNIGTSTHTYIANSVAVHNCYQGHKSKKAMSFDTAKKCVDMLLSSTPENNKYINPEISPGIILEFIGGEPFLEIELIDQICDYFLSEARRLQHPWAEWYCISICSNGVLYFDDTVQRFLYKHRNNMSFSVTIDGNKELHDACRVFHDGQPSYDLAVAAAKDWMDRGYYMGSKITIAPENISFLYDAITHMIGLGYTEINANCVYEEGWTYTHATVLYSEMKRITDYLLENDLENEIYISLFEDIFFRPKDPDDNQNWCGGLSDMLCVDPSGYYSICIRYLPSSLGEDQPPIYLGDVDNGLLATDEQKKCHECMSCITRRSQSSDECFNCPIAEGCAWCFKAGTLITTPDGEKPIEDITVGDLVISGSGNVKEVEQINKRFTEDTIVISTDRLQDIWTTYEHPFLVYRDRERVWVKAEDLSVGDELVVYGDECAVVTWLDKDVEGYEVYNMSVADDHTFIANGAIVHNCSAYNYQVNGTPDSRVTYICPMHKARSLANAYFWNKYYRKAGSHERFKIHCPDEWALEIISEKELNMLKELERPE